ncbi:MAG TPA: UDP-N-acetylglucosamine 2-epimerase (non-hydrolyzing) [Candidatus Paceibacterota bacterium]|nr:UDP-N-acetylglucosamine 2-epimerase (non-hydrolyzing) [Verrucomicrobiota bacterium]HRY51932.1 UDP-N-acetylglucosamine 2-epimerase (non-hydrolyzing) [Candidatus Paceibacterota bacterium]HRZ99776.1 UDP-N-acetylglucosamine 2-epimerase (non-hydrolyzing) [Candidatus Paceibacterota bacterium]
MTLVTIIGARPQFIKAAVVSHAIRRIPGIREVLVHTGQHYDDNMSAVFFQELEIPEPAHNLGIGSGSHGAQTGRQLLAIEETLLREKPDCVLVYGDTNSTLAGALAAAKLNVPIAHVEAGLRSFNRSMPEEINRVLTDHCASLLFAPTDLAVQNLIREGIPQHAIHRVGDVMFDVALHFAHKAEQQSRVLTRLDLIPKQFVLATIHRAANTDDPVRLKNILDGLEQVARVIPVVFPIHPRTRVILEKQGRLPELSNNTPQLKVIAPVGYLDMLMLEKNAAVIATDSGGVQKEAFFYQTPCVTLRDETEWRELIDSGWNRLCPPSNPETIRHTILSARGARGNNVQPYGDGTAAEKIAALLT